MIGSDAKLRMGAVDWGLLVTLALLWAGSFFFFKILITALPPFTIVFGRVLIAALVLNLVIVARGGRLPADRRLWANFVVMGLLNNVVPFSLIVFGETQVSSGVASILNATTPMFTVLAAQVFTDDERLDAAKLAGLALGLCGVAVLVGPAALQGLGAGDAWGEAAVLGAAVSPLEVAAGQLVGSSVLSLPLCLLVDRPWTLPMPGPGAWAALLALAVVSTALAYILFFRILARAGATNVSLVTLLVPVGAVLLGWVALDEALAPAAWFGMGIVALGLVCLDGRALTLFGPRRIA